MIPNSPQEPAAGMNVEDYVWKANKELPASLFARLAEAADGIRNGKRIYFVAQLKPDQETGHDVIGYFNSPQEALEHPEAKKHLVSGRYLIFGPFKTQDDPYYTPKDIEKVVIYHRTLGQITLPGDKFDCVFWSLSAMDKFVIPYYTSFGDLEKAERVRKDFIKEAAVAGIHIPGSDIVNETTSTAIGTAVSSEKIRDRVGLYLVRESSDPMIPGGIDFTPL